MESHVSNRPLGMTVIAALALAQGLFGVLRTLHWVEVGGDFMGRGLVVMPLLRMLALGRGVVVAVVAVLFGVFSYGLLQRRSWARRLGIFLSFVSLLLVVSAVIHGESLARALVWAIVPVVILCYLLSPLGRQVLNAEAKCCISEMFVELGSQELARPGV
jgi:hypothetical protein